MFNPNEIESKNERCDVAKPPSSCVGGTANGTIHFVPHLPGKHRRARPPSCDYGPGVILESIVSARTCPKVITLVTWTTIFSIVPVMDG